MSDFLKDLLGNKKNKLEQGSKLTIKHDKWDFSDWGKIVTEMKELSNADDRLTDFTPTGHEAMTDAFLALYKAMPKIEDQKNIRPSYLVNARVASEMQELKEYEELRTYSTLDLVASGMACVAIEPDLEVLFDRLKDEQEKAQRLEQMMQQMGGMEEEQKSIEEMIEEALAEGDGQKVEDYQEQAARIAEAMENLRQQIQEGTEDLEQSLDGKKEVIAQGMKTAIDKAKEQAENVDSLSTSWGLDPGTIKKMSAEKRIQLAKRINNEKFRRLAELIGPMQRLAMAEQSRKLEFAKDEIYDLELGSDIQHVLPEELLFLTDLEIDMLFYKKFFEDNLMQFKLQGTEKVAKGGIIFAEDGSGSMAGQREIWAKAVGLALLTISRSQNREFHGIHFCGPGVWKSFTFDIKTRRVDTLDYRKKAQTFDELDGVLDFAETFMNGGPLRLDQRVVTPNGWKPIGDMVVGDTVFGPDGKITSVVGVYPQGKLDLYEVAFSDGAKVICDGTHIWTVSTPDSGWRDMTLNEMLSKGLVYERIHGGRFKFKVPNQEPVELAEAKFPVHPYLLGYLMGDGTLGGGRSISVHSSEEEHPWAEFVDGEITTYQEPTSVRCGSYGLKNSSVLEGIKSLGLLGIRGENKFVPEEYLWGSIKQRFDLLSGLLDADGNVGKQGGFEFFNTSQNLAESVVHLAQSLGGVAFISEKKVRENEKPLWRVSGRISPSLGAPFRLTRKKDAYVQHKFFFTRSIISATRVKSDEAICIKVDREDGLFLTEGFVVTHNTDFVTPLSLAIDKLQAQFDKDGKIKGDIVFCTDGQCGVPPAFLEKLAEKKLELGFRIFGIVLGGEPQMEPLNTICDGRVWSVRDLINGKDIGNIFRDV